MQWKDCIHKRNKIAKVMSNPQMLCAQNCSALLGNIQEGLKKKMKLFILFVGKILNVFKK